MIVNRGLFTEQEAIQLIEIADQHERLERLERRQKRHREQESGSYLWQAEQTLGGETWYLHCSKKFDAKKKARKERGIRPYRVKLAGYSAWSNRVEKPRRPTYRERIARLVEERARSRRMSWPADEKLREYFSVIERGIGMMGRCASSLVMSRVKPASGGISDEMLEIGAALSWLSAEHRNAVFVRYTRHIWIDALRREMKKRGRETGRKTSAQQKAAWKAEVENLTRNAVFREAMRQLHNVNPASDDERKRSLVHRGVISRGHVVSFLLKE